MAEIRASTMEKPDAPCCVHCLRCFHFRAFIAFIAFIAFGAGAAAAFFAAFIAFMAFIALAMLERVAKGWDTTVGLKHRSLLILKVGNSPKTTPTLVSKLKRHVCLLALKHTQVVMSDA